MADYVNLLKELGVDAVIVSDLGCWLRSKASVPTMEVHVSTQANCQNYRAGRFTIRLVLPGLYLPEELSLAEIADLRANVPDDLVLEAFIHGAMCMAYSGRCLLSAYLTGRSGNRGECAQSCRWNYHLVEETRPGEYFQSKRIQTERQSSVPMIFAVFSFFRSNFGCRCYVLENRGAYENAVSCCNSNKRLPAGA